MTMFLFWPTWAATLGPCAAGAAVKRVRVKINLTAVVALWRITGVSSCGNIVKRLAEFKAAKV
jgi:hypothetical protein